MLSAPEAFMAVANATAAIVHHDPAYVTYRVSGTMHFARGDAAIARTVTVRTVDGNAVVRDERTGDEVLEPPFPAPPTFDALAHFTLQGEWSALPSKEGTTRDVQLRVTNVAPLQYTMTESHADVVVHSVRGYTITYGQPGSDGTTHLQLAPTPQYFVDGPHRTAWLHDVWYDPVTLVPTHVVWNGHDRFELDARYATVDGVWLLHELRVAQVFHTLGVIQTAAWFDGVYDGYVFSATPPDPRLVPTPAASSAATAGRTRPMTVPLASRS